MQLLRCGFEGTFDAFGFETCLQILFKRFGQNDELRLHAQFWFHVRRRNSIALPFPSFLLRDGQLTDRQQPFLAVFRHLNGFLVKSNPVFVPPRILLLISSELHLEFFAAGRGVETDHVISEVVLGLLLDESVETIFGDLRAEGHHPIGQRDELIQLLDACHVEMERMRVLGVHKEDYLHEEALPSLQVVALQTGNVHLGG